MRYSIALAFIGAALITGCSPKSRSMPNLNDQASITAAAKSLSPWDDGSPDRSSDGRIIPENHSDRAMFYGWLARYQGNALSQDDKNYKPMPIPSTLGQAVDEQRQFQTTIDAQATQTATLGKQQADAIAAQQAREAQAEEAARQQQATISTGYSGHVLASGENQASSEPVSKPTNEDSTTLPFQDFSWHAPDAATGEADFHCRIDRQHAVADAGTDQAAIARAIRTTPCPSDKR